MAQTISDRTRVNRDADEPSDAPQNSILNQDGASSPEYALLLVFIAVACVGALTLLGTIVSLPYLNLAGGI